MSQQNSDAKYRQNLNERIIDAGIEKVNVEYEQYFYKDIDKKLGEMKDPRNINSEQQADAASVKKQIDFIYSEFMGIVDNVNDLYTEYAQYTLNPDKEIYSTVGPVRKTIDTFIQFKKLALIMMGAIVLSFGLICGLALVVGAVEKQLKTVKS